MTMIFRMLLHAVIKVLIDTDAANEMQTVCGQKWIEPGIGSGIRWRSIDLIEPQRQPQKPFSEIKSQLRGSFGQIYPLLGKRKIFIPKLRH